jgi:hypothetical protein
MEDEAEIFERLELVNTIEKYGVKRYVFSSCYGTIFTLSLSQVHKLMEIVDQELQREYHQKRQAEADRISNELFGDRDGQQDDVGNTSPNSEE